MTAGVCERAADLQSMQRKTRLKVRQTQAPSRSFTLRRREFGCGVTLEISRESFFLFVQKQQFVKKKNSSGSKSDIVKEEITTPGRDYMTRDVNLA